MSDIWGCEYYNRCQNAERCLSCGPDQRLLKLKEDKKRAKYNKRKSSAVSVTNIDDNTGQTLEEYVRLRLNDLPSVKEFEAYRQAGSGNIWFMPGDVADPIILAECKERYTITAAGKQTISITKDMLEKIMREAKMLSKYPALPFRYKGDPSGRTYVVNDFDVLVEMVHEIKMLRSENEYLRRERDMYKQVSEELYSKRKED